MFTIRDTLAFGGLFPSPGNGSISTSRQTRPAERTNGKGRLTAAFSFVASFALLWLVDKALGLRVSEQDERIGLDLTQHRETAYTLLD